MSEATVIRTVGQADLLEDITFNSNDRLLVGDLVDLKPTKPTDAPVYGQARVVRYPEWNGVGHPTKFVARRIL